MLLSNIIWRQFHLLCPLKSSFALHQGLLRSNLRLLLPPLHSCRDCGVEPPEATKQEDDQHANHPDDHQQGTVPLFDLLLSNNDLLAGVDVVLHAEHPVGGDEDKDDDGHAPVRDQHSILQFLLLDLLDACICLSQALSNVNLFFSYPSTLFIEVLKSFPLNGLVHRNQIFVCIHSNRLVPVVNVFQ